MVAVICVLGLAVGTDWEEIREFPFCVFVTQSWTHILAAPDEGRFVTRTVHHPTPWTPPSPTPIATSLLGSKPGRGVT